MGYSTVHYSFHSWQRRIRYIIWGLALFVVLYIAWKNVVPTGNMTVRFTVPRGSPMVEHFASKEPYRLLGIDANTGEQYQVITKSPLYFDVTVPRHFSKAKMSVVYQNPDDQASIRLGVQRGEGQYQYYDLAFALPLLENLPDEWEAIRERNLVLWQKNNEYLKEKLRVEDQRAKLAEGYNAAISALKIQVEDGKQNENDVSRRIAKLNLDLQSQLTNLNERLQAQQRPSVPYLTIREFLQALPNPKVTLQFNTDLTSKALFPSIPKTQKATVLDKAVRGSHTLKTYVHENETLTFSFTAQSINRHNDIDNVAVSISQGEQVVATKSITLDTQGKKLGEPSLPQQVNLRVPELHEGIYTIAIKTTDDVFLSDISTSQRILMFYGSVYVAENEEYRMLFPNKVFQPTSLITDSSSLSATTSHENGLQTITVGEKTIRLQKPQKKLTILDFSGLTQINTPRNDVRLEGDGYFAFSKDAYAEFPKSFPVVDDNTNLEQYDYIFANYPKASRNSNGLLVASADIDELSYDKSSAAHFIIALDGLQEKHKQLLIHEVAITFYNQPLTFSRIIEKVRTMLHLL